MNILGRLALLFIVVPLLELVLLVKIGQVVGLFPTIALVIFTGVTGAWLARAEGLRVFFQFQKELASGKLPGQALLDGLSVLVGGAVLLTPGVLTDLFGFSLLFPPTRRWMQRRVRKRLERGITDGSIRVVSTGFAGFGGVGGFGFGQAEGPAGSGNGQPGTDWNGPVSAQSSGGDLGTRAAGSDTPRPGATRARRPTSGLDPSNEIVVDED